MGGQQGICSSFGLGNWMDKLETEDRQRKGLGQKQEFGVKLVDTVK
jgi:hypothetical protein